VPPQCLRGLRELCDKHGLLLIFDEVQTGVGRSGRFFAHQRAGVTPDIMAVAKGIGGGFPLGACLSTFEAGKGMTAGTHGTTYGGNPLAMAVGNAVLDEVLKQGFLDHVDKISNQMRQGLAAIKDRHPSIIEDVRGEGLLLGVKAKVPNTDLVAALRDQKMLTVGAGDNVVRLLPPLIISEEEARDGLARLEKACAALEAKLAAEQKGAAE
jgi:acetylornithine/N-succinyldiaminopimelate aminotransferase